MEVSSLRDRRLVALFATLVIGGSGVAAAVVSLEGGPVYRGPAVTEAALAPQFSKPSSKPDPKPVSAPPPAVVVAAEDPPADSPSGAAPASVPPTGSVLSTSSPSSGLTASAPDPCGAAGGVPKAPHASKTSDNCARNAKSVPTPNPLTVAGPGMVAAAAPESKGEVDSPSHPDEGPAPRAQDEGDQSPPRPGPKSGAGPKSAPASKSQGKGGR